ncbi:Aste57867_11469 [Aphanomyces stellatus]|uniref:Aste57867_11469 protein n=1 Tax=Aphanomyces stellatus TaxID=120398 RepID=A0A485KT49_9STRA|nr:hypothetical protein As57867_011426 [Aphanomyces stellatus]VFT88330.1 Aste57867_11469 [Aphanomyces stellatus]
MANFAARQIRYQDMVSTGAVFFESILRILPYKEFFWCWGTSFEVAIANELRQSAIGQSWLTSVSSDSKCSILDEVSYWKSNRIERLTTQWQNYKSIGAVNTYSVENALGTAYEFTLHYTNMSFRLPKQTTYKMYWGLANDFFAITQNDSTVGGQSLVRSSPNFAFANTTMQYF